MRDDGTLPRIAALLRQAEGTINEHEADAFMQAAQRLASAHSIDLAVARSHTSEKERRTAPVMQRIEIGQPGAKGLRTYASLFMAIGRANDLTFDVAHNSTYVIAFGFANDIEATKALYSSLAVQMVRASDTFIKSGEYRQETIWRRVTRRDEWGTHQGWANKPAHASTARINFQLAYGARIGRRLTDAREQAEQQAIAAEQAGKGDTAHRPDAAAPTGTELVLREKAIEVRDFHKANSTARGTWRGARAASGYSDHARRAGDRAAEYAPPPPSEPAGHPKR
jgi:hypothetical protein